MLKARYDPESQAEQTLHVAEASYAGPGISGLGLDFGYYHKVE